VQERLKKAGDGRPRLFVFRDALVDADPALMAARKPYATVHEFDAYVWPKGQDGKPQKEVPVDEDNHGMDALRYIVAWADKLGSSQYTPAVAGHRPTTAGFVVR